MKIEELSIGDWVQDKKGTKAQILGIEKWSDGYELNVRLKGVDVGNTPATSVHPIPLTPVILEKNGFCPPPKHCGYYQLTVGNEEVFVCIDNGFSEFSHYSKGFVSDEEYINKLEISHSMFVHELQHALCLAGIEKEIEV